MNEGLLESGGHSDPTTRKYELLARFLSQVGFPIVVAAFLLWRLDHTLINLSENIRISIAEQREANNLMRLLIQQRNDDLKLRP